MTKKTAITIAAVSTLITALYTAVTYSLLSSLRDFDSLDGFNIDFEE